MSTVKLTPNMLKRMVLEEKKKLEGAMLDKAALKEMEMDMDESDWSAAPPHAVKRTHATGSKVKQDGGGAGDVTDYKTLKKLEETLTRRLEQVREQKQVLRRKILASK
jgi:hypothetical protein